MVSILLIDDDLSTTEKVHSILDREGFHVHRALLNASAFRALATGDPDLVVLGVQPQEKGWQFCRQVLLSFDRPLLLLLSTTDKTDRAKGLELGAADCMLKPVLLAELVARVRTLLRWSTTESGRRRRRIVDGDLAVDLARREVLRDGQPVALSSTDFRLLACFVRHEGQVLSQERLIGEVWGSDDPRTCALLKQYVFRLRQKLELNPHRPKRIVTRRGEGYTFRWVHGGQTSLP